MLMLSNAWTRQTGRLLECNANFGTLRDWKAKVLKEYPDTQFIESREEFDEYLRQTR